MNDTAAGSAGATRVASGRHAPSRVFATIVLCVAATWGCAAARHAPVRADSHQRAAIHREVASGPSRPRVSPDARHGVAVAAGNAETGPYGAPEFSSEPQPSRWGVDNLTYGPMEIAFAAAGPACGLFGGFDTGVFATRTGDANPRWWQNDVIAYGIVGPVVAIGGVVYGSLMVAPAVLNGTWNLLTLGATTDRPYLFFGLGSGPDRRRASPVYLCAGGR